MRVLVPGAGVPRGGKFAEGGPAAASAAQFEAVILPHLDRAYRLARYLARDKAVAEDVTQDAMLRAFRALGGFRGGDPRAWLLAIVRNTFYNQAAATRRDGGKITSVAAAAACEPNTAESPEAALLRRRDGETVRAIVEGLPAPFRETLILRELEDLSYREIAEITGAPIGTVMSRLARARALFAAAWADAESPS